MQRKGALCQIATVSFSCWSSIHLGPLLLLAINCFLVKAVAGDWWYYVWSCVTVVEAWALTHCPNAKEPVGLFTGSFCPTSSNQALRGTYTFSPSHTHTDAVLLTQTSSNCGISFLIDDFNNCTPTDPFPGHAQTSTWAVPSFSELPFLQRRSQWLDQQTWWVTYP